MRLAEPPFHTHTHAALVAAKQLTRLLPKRFRGTVVVANR
jgi:hypothetical protein